MNTYFTTSIARSLAGLNGKSNKINAERIVKSVENHFYNDEIIFEGDGAMKWKSNGAYLPEDCAEAVAFIDLSKANEEQRACVLNASVERTAKKRDKQNEDFLEAYRKRNENRELSDEERFEMECAFGKGTTVVNVITGRTIVL